MTNEAKSGPYRSGWVFKIDIFDVSDLHILL